MAYNPFPVGYQPAQIYYPQAQQQIMQNNQQMQNNNIIWVQGETGAKSYLVAPNTTVPLWDSEAPIIYLKSADASGMPSIKVLEYSVRGEKQPNEVVIEDKTTNISEEDYNALKDEIKALRNDLDKMKKPRTRKIVEVEDDE